MLQFSLSLWNIHLAEELAFLSPFKWWQVFQTCLNDTLQNQALCSGARLGELEESVERTCSEIRVSWEAENSGIMSLADCLEVPQLTFFHISQTVELNKSHCVFPSVLKSLTLGQSICMRMGFLPHT